MTADIKIYPSIPQKLCWSFHHWLPCYVMFYSHASTTEKTLWNNIFSWVLPNPPPSKITSAELSHSSHWVSGHDLMARDALEKEWHSVWHHNSTVKHCWSSVNSGQIAQQATWMAHRTQPSSEKTEHIRELAMLLSLLRVSSSCHWEWHSLEVDTELNAPARASLMFISVRERGCTECSIPLKAGL